jgi:chromosome segregation ATPase
MLTPSQHIEQIGSRISKLLKQYKTLEKENEKLKSELDRMREIESEIKIRNQRLEQQLNLLKASAGASDKASMKEMEQQLNHYIREIDRCIALLGA